MRTICSVNSGLPDDLRNASTGGSGGGGVAGGGSGGNDKNKITHHSNPELAQLNREALPDSCQSSSSSDHIKLPATETTLKLLKSYLEKYREFVKFNPIWISDIESALYWVSYLLSSMFFF